MSSDRGKTHRTLLEYVPSGAVVLNLHGEVVYMNPSAEKMLHISIEDVEGKSLKEVLDSESGRLFSISIEKVKERKGVYTFYMKQNNKKFIKVSISPIIQDEGVSGFLMIMDDVTEEVVTSITTNKLIREMMDAIRLSLKTLTSMLERADALKRGGIEEELLPSLKQMEMNLRRIQEISPEIPQRIETDLGGFIRTLFEVIGSKMGSKKVNFVFRIGTPPKVFITKSLLGVKLTTFMEGVVERMREGDVVWVRVDTFNGGNKKVGCVIVIPVVVKDEEVEELRANVERDGGNFVKLNFKDECTGIAFSFSAE